MLLVIGYGIVACIFMIFFGKYLSLLFVAGNETSVINDAQQFLICNSIFYFVLGILFVSRNTIQGLGKSALTMLAGGAELVARAFVAFALVGKFGYNAICFANPIAWFAAIIILIPTLVIKRYRNRDIFFYTRFLFKRLWIFCIFKSSSEIVFAHSCNSSLISSGTLLSVLYLSLCSKEAQKSIAIVRSCTST